MSGEQSALSVVVAGGGTAGHIEPALAVADAIRRLVPTATITALGTERGLETTLVPQRGYPLELIPPVPLPRKLTADLAKLPARVLASVRRTREVLDHTHADVVVGFGGYVALPAYLAAGAGPLRRRRRIPVVVHEANARAGIANKIGALRAERVLAAVPGSGIVRRGDAEIVGIPVRSSITGLDRAALRAQARAHFGLPPEGRCCWCSVARRAPVRSTRPSREPPVRSPRRASPCCTPTARRTPSTCPHVPSTTGIPTSPCPT